MEGNFNPQELLQRLQNPTIGDQERALLTQLVNMAGLSHLVPQLEKEEDDTDGKDDDYRNLSLEDKEKWFKVVNPEDPFDVALVEFLKTTPNIGNSQEYRFMSGQLADRMLTMGFGVKDYKEFLKNLYHGKQIKSGLCRRVLTAGVDVGYQCLDCQKDPTAIICASCFEKGDHTGHRVFFKSNVSGMCDCGDSDAWEVKGFCCDHTGFVEEDQYLSIEQKNSLQKYIKKTFYYIFQAIEIYGGAKQKDLYSTFFNDVLDYLSELCGVYVSLTPVVSRAFHTSICWDPSKPLTLHHNPAVNDGYFNPTLDCYTIDSSALSLILRYNLRLLEKNQKILHDFLISLFVDSEFKKFFAKEYIENFRYYYIRATIRHGSSKVRDSELFSLAIQILTTEGPALYGMQNCNFGWFLEAYSEIFQKCVKKNIMRFEKYFLLYKAMQVLEHCLLKKAGVQFCFSQPDMIDKYLAPYVIFQKNSCRYSLDYDRDTLTDVGSDTFSQLELMEHLLSSHSENCSVLSNFSKKEKTPLIVNILRGLKKKIYEANDNSDRSEEDDKFSKISIFFCLERIFILYVVCHCYTNLGGGQVEVKDFNYKDFKDLMEQVFDSPEERSNFWMLLLRNFAMVSGFLREITRFCWNCYSTVLTDVKENYYRLLPYQLDLTGLQFATLEIKPEVYIKEFKKAYFLGQPEEKNWLKALQDRSGQEFMHLISDFYLMLREVICNEIQTPNLIYRMMSHAKSVFGEDTVSEAFPSREAFEKYLGQYLTVVSPIPLKIFNKSSAKLIKDSKFIEEYLSFNAVFDKKNNLVKIAPHTAEKIKKAGIDVDLVWYDSSETSKIVDNFNSKFTKNDPIQVTKRISSLNQRISRTLYDLEVLKELSNFLLEVSKVSISHLNQPLRSFVKTVLQIFPQAESATSLKKLEADWPAPPPKQDLEKYFKDNLSQILQLFSSLTGEASSCEDWSASAKLKLSLVSKNILNQDLSVNISDEERFAQNKKIEQERKEWLQKRLEEKKAKIMRKMTERKSKFMVKLNKDSDAVVNKLNKNDQALTCPISQESLTSAATYFMCSQIHFSNLTKSAVVSTLNELLHNPEKILEKNLFDGVVGLRDQAISDCKKPSAMLLSSCQHFISRSSVLDKQNKSKVYIKMENPCPICQRPANCFVPIFKKQVFDSLQKAKVAQPESLTLSNLLQNLQLKLESSDPKEAQASVYKIYLKDDLDIFSSEQNCIDNLKNNIVGQLLLFCDGFERAVGKVEKMRISFESIICKSLAEILNYIEIHGLAHSAKDFALIYHNVYLALRISQILEALEEKPSIENQEILDRIILNLAQFFLKCDETSSDFVSVDLDSAFSGALFRLSFLLFNENEYRIYSKLVTELFINARLRQMKLRLGIESSKTWEEVKNGPHGKQIVSQLVKMLRMSALFKYTTQLTTYLNQKSLFAQIVKCNLTGDEKELFYLLEFTQIKIDSSLHINLFQSGFRKATNAFPDKLTPPSKSMKIETPDSPPKSMMEEDLPENPPSQKNPSKLCPSSSSCTVSQILDLTNRELSFNLIDLPDNFFTLYNTYLKKNCELCHKKHNKNEIGLCLLCGAVICVGSCNGEISKENMGNLCKHSFSHHHGTCAFLNTHTGKLILYEETRLYVFSGPYRNGFGIVLSEYKSQKPDFKQFNLDSSEIDQVKKRIVDLDVASSIVLNNIKNNSLFYEQTL